MNIKEAIEHYELKKEKLGATMRKLEIAQDSRYVEGRPFNKYTFLSQKEFEFKHTDLRERIQRVRITISCLRASEGPGMWGNAIAEVNSEIRMNKELVEKASQYQGLVVKQTAEKEIVRLEALHEGLQQAVLSKFKLGGEYLDEL